MGAIPVRPESFFLLLDVIDLEQARFRRVGIGSGDPRVVNIVFAGFGVAVVTLT